MNHSAVPESPQSEPANKLASGAAKVPLPARFEPVADEQGLVAPQPLPANIGSIQPGGGCVQALELAWGRVRRSLLKTFFPGYVAHMRQQLQGDSSACPVEVIDPRDLKYFGPLVPCRFTTPDPFAWRGRMGFARWGLAELFLLGGLGLVLSVAAFWLPAPWRGAAVVPALLTAFVLYFFRDPPRRVPTEPGVVVSPADGWVVDIREVDDPEFLGEPALQIGIFLSVFNVHINRSPVEGRIIALRYQPGEFLNALRADSAQFNERMEVFAQETAVPHRRFIVRQIAGAIARRIVCDTAPGETLQRGQRFGMIKFGSRTELVVPRRGLTVRVQKGERVWAGVSTLACYEG